MEEFDFMQARKELQEKLGEFYIVSVFFTGEKRLSIRSISAILDMDCIGTIYWFCAEHHLQYYVCNGTGGFPTFEIYQ